MSDKSKELVVVVGAGPAGLTAAWELCQRGISTIVLESDPTYVGGLARTVQYRGCRFDLGGHRFFSKNQEIVDWWRDVLDPADFIEVPRISRIFYNKKFFDYPLKPFNALFNLGPLQSLACVIAYMRRSTFPIAPEVSFKDWVTNRFGDRLFEIFFRSYTEKVWGMKCEEISSDWAAQRIKGLSLRVAILNACGIGTKSGDDGAVVKTLTDTFHYPRLGPGMMWEKVQTLIEQTGGRVRLGQKVESIRLEGDTPVAVSSRNVDGELQETPCTAVINTMPLRHFIPCIDPSLPADLVEKALRLRYRDFLIVALIVDDLELFPDNWIYIHDPSVRAGRLQNYGNWSPELVMDGKHSLLGVEYFCSSTDDLWKNSDAELVKIATSEMDQLGLVHPTRITDGTVVRVPNAYPVYDDEYQDIVTEIQRWISKRKNMWTVGRNGMHKYNNQDHSMMTALLAARRYLGDRVADPWVVNTDAEYLEERRVPRSVD